MGNCFYRLVKTYLDSQKPVCFDKGINTTIISREDRGISTNNLQFLYNDSEMPKSGSQKLPMSPIPHSSDNNDKYMDDGRSFVKSLIESSLTADVKHNSRKLDLIKDKPSHADYAIKGPVINENEGFKLVPDVIENQKKGHPDDSKILITSKTSLDSIGETEYDPAIPVPTLTLRANEDIEITAELPPNFGVFETELLGVPDLPKKKLGGTKNNFLLSSDIMGPHYKEAKAFGALKASQRNHMGIRNETSFTPINFDSQPTAKTDVSAGEGKKNQTPVPEDKDEGAIFHMEETCVETDKSLEHTSPVSAQPHNYMTGGASGVPLAARLSRKEDLRQGVEGRIACQHTGPEWIGSVKTPKPATNVARCRDSEKRKPDASFLNREIDPRVPSITSIASISLNSNEPFDHQTSPKREDVDTGNNPKNQSFRSPRDVVVPPAEACGPGLNSQVTAVKHAVGEVVGENANTNPLNPDNYMINILYMDAEKNYREKSENNRQEQPSPQ